MKVLIKCCDRLEALGDCPRSFFPLGLCALKQNRALGWAVSSEIATRAEEALAVNKEWVFLGILWVEWGMSDEAKWQKVNRLAGLDSGDDFFRIRTIALFNLTVKKWDDIGTMGSGSVGRLICELSSLIASRQHVSIDPAILDFLTGFHK